MTMHEIQAILFDLDGVLTDTAELHYRAWARLAEEEGLPFDRAVNERLRGIGRSESLDIVLAGRQLSPEQHQAWTDRKNAYYVQSLDGLTPADVLPGARELLEQCRAAGLRTAVASVSRNSAVVLDRIGLVPLLDAVADGTTVARSKPAPDVFLAAAAALGVPPGLCVVVEDASAGIDAGLAAGSWTVGIGPAERVGHAHTVLPDLAGVTLTRLLAAVEAGSWSIRVPGVDEERLHHHETLLTIGNGNLCVRGALEEGHPHDGGASFMHRVWDDMPVQVTELAALPRWWGVDLWADGTRLRCDTARLVDSDRSLDIRDGVLSRRSTWQPHADTDATVTVVAERIVSLAEPHLAMLRLRVQVSETTELRMRTGLDAHVENTGLLHWRVIDQHADADRADLLVRTRSTGIELAAHARVGACVHPAGSPSAAQPVAGTGTDADGQPAVEHRLTLHPGDRLVLVKAVALVPDLDDAEAAGEPTAHLPGRAAAVAAAAYQSGWEGVLAASRAAWEQVWQACDIVVDGDPEAQISLRYNMFQLVIAAPRHTDRASIGAKTLSGFGYRHHVFWDTEIFMLPMFSHTVPELAANMLRYRWHNLPGARRKAAAGGYRGAQFPWESAGTGDEVTPTWVPHFARPEELVRIWTGDIELHITADIAYAVLAHWRVTGDDDFLVEHGAEIVLDGASFWASVARLEPDGRYHLRDVIGPDEYHDRVDDNAFTNEMARWHLREAIAVHAWMASHAQQQLTHLTRSLGIGPGDLATWAEVADRLHVPTDPVTGLVEQFDGYFTLADADPAVLRDPGRSTSMQMLLGIEGCARTQVLKQPDVLMLSYLLPETFDAAAHAANYAYYDPRTDHEHGSSLGPSISAVVASRIGDPEAAYRHFLRAARADLLDVRHNADDGIHGASAGGLWQAAVLGFAGLQVSDSGEVTTRPQLPAHWHRLTVRLTVRGRPHVVVVGAPPR